MKLAIFEMKRCLKNPIFLLTVILLFVFIDTQFAGDNPQWIINKPIPGQENYGYIVTEDMNLVRKQALNNLLMEYSANSYITYPYGFYRNIQLNDKKNGEIEKILSALTGASIQDIKSIQSSATKDGPIALNEKIDQVLKNSEKNRISDNDYLDLMEDVDRLLGGGSSYSKKFMFLQFGKKPKTYEEAVLEYNAMIHKDKTTGTFARLFCDYAGIAIAFLPIFLPVALWFKDKKSNCSHTLYSKKSSSRKLVLSRFFAMLLLFTLVVLLIATFYNVKIIKANGMKNVDIFAFYKYALIWLIPSLMVVLSVGSFTTILTNSPVGIIVMLGWWFITLFGGQSRIYGGYGYQLIIRHNILGNTNLYFSNFHLILLNRIIYVALSIILIIFSIKIYNRKREGRIFQIGSHKKDCSE